MRILIIHNKYLETGGEDFSSKLEAELLRKNENIVKEIIYSNKQFDNINKVLSYILTIFNFKVFFQLIKEIDRFKPDIIHVHNFFYYVSPAVFYAAKWKKIPALFTIRNYRLICINAFLLRSDKVCELCVSKKFPWHGVKYKCFKKSKLQSFLLQINMSIHNLINTWNRITKIIVLTEFAKDKLKNSSLKIAHDKVVVKGNFCPDFGFSPEEKRMAYYLFIGRISSEKGIRLLVDVFDNKTDRLEVIGDGPLLNFLSNKSSKNIVFHGFKNHEFIISKLRQCKALIFPSIWYEGLPRTIIEAFSTGTPVIASNLSNINEIVINGYNGITFLPESSSDLMKVLKSDKLNSELYLNARATFLEKYSEQQNYSKLISIYDSVITK